MADQSRPGGRRASDSWWSELDTLAERVDTMTGHLGALEGRVGHMEAAHDRRMSAMEASIGVNTSATLRIEKAVLDVLAAQQELTLRTGEAVDLAETFKSMGKVFDWLLNTTTRVGKPLSYVATTLAAAAAFWQIWKALQ